MFPRQRVGRFAVAAFAAAALLSHADAARADSPNWSSGCGCGDAMPATGWVSSQPVSQPVSQPGTLQARPFWMRPTPPYTSSSVQVPLTNYQTQVVNDPLSGVAVTTYQPCNTYESQVRRTAGCSLWQRFVNWWNSRCRCLSSRSTPPAMMTCCPTTTCPPTSEWVVTSPEPAAAPYYVPAPNGRVVPNPSSVLPTSPVPADRPPQLDLDPGRSGGEGSASRLLPPGSAVFVRMLNGPAPSLELGPPLVAPGPQDAEAEVAEDTAPSLDTDLEDRNAAAAEASLELVPVSWLVPAPLHENKLPTDEVWDDTGWQSAR